MLNSVQLQGIVVEPPTYVLTENRHRLSYVWIVNERYHKVTQIDIKNPAKTRGHARARSKTKAVKPKERTYDFIRLKAWDGNADLVKKHFEPGLKVLVDGTLQNDFVHYQGQISRRLCVTVRRIHIIGIKDFDNLTIEKQLELQKQNDVIDGEIMKNQEPPAEFLVADKPEELDWGSSWLGLKVRGGRPPLPPEPPDENEPDENGPDPRDKTFDDEDF